MRILYMSRPDGRSCFFERRLMPVRHNDFGQSIGPDLPGWAPRSLPPRRALEGRFCTLEPLDAARHVDDLHAAYAQAPDGRDWTYLGIETTSTPRGPMSSASPRAPTRCTSLSSTGKAAVPSVRWH